MECKEQVVLIDSVFPGQSEICRYLALPPEERAKLIAELPLADQINLLWKMGNLNKGSTK